MSNRILRLTLTVRVNKTVSVRSQSVAFYRPHPKGCSQVWRGTSRYLPPVQARTGGYAKVPIPLSRPGLWEGVPKGTYPPGQGTYPPSISGLGGVPQGTYPPNKVTPPPRGKGQQREYLICCGWYASCLHAGGLSCFFSILYQIHLIRWIRGFRFQPYSGRFANFVEWYVYGTCKQFFINSFTVGRVFSFQFCIRFTGLDELAEFNWNQSIMTAGLWKFFCVLHSQPAHLV